MERYLVLSIIVAALSLGCSKSDEALPTGSVTNPATPTPVGEDIGSTESEDDEQQTNDDQTNEDQTGGTDISEEQEEDEVDVISINPNDPCYKYMNDKVSIPVANCKKMMNGRLGGSYPNIVKFGKVCLLKSTYNNGITLYTVEGNFIQVDDDWNQVVHGLYGFKETQIESDRVKFNFKDDGLKTSVNYDLVDETISIKQVTKTFKKKVRNFKLGCTPVHSIR